MKHGHQTRSQSPRVICQFCPQFLYIDPFLPWTEMSHSFCGQTPCRWGGREGGLLYWGAAHLKFIFQETFNMEFTPCGMCYLPRMCYLRHLWRGMCRISLGVWNLSPSKIEIMKEKNWQNWIRIRAESQRYLFQVFSNGMVFFFFFFFTNDNVR